MLAAGLSRGCDLCDGIERADSPVVRLTEATADAILSAHELALVGFYAPWCEVCKWFAPTYEKVAEVLRAEGVLVSKVNVADEPKLAQRFDAHVKQAPILVVVRRGLAIPYHGGRTGPELLELMREHERPAVLELGDDADAVARYLRAPPAHMARVLVRTVQPASARTGAMSEVDRAAGALRGEVAFARAAPVLGETGAGAESPREPASEEPCTVQMTRPWASADASADEPEVVKYTGPVETRRLRAWAAWRAAPLVAALSPANAGTYLRRGHVAVLALGAGLSGTERAAFVAQLERLARSHAAEADAGRAVPVWWVHLGKAEGVHGRLLERLGFAAAGGTQLALLNVSAPAHFAQHTLRAHLHDPASLPKAVTPLLDAYSRGASRADVRVFGMDARDAAVRAALSLCALLCASAAWCRLRPPANTNGRARKRAAGEGRGSRERRARRAETAADSKPEAASPQAAGAPVAADGMPSASDTGGLTPGLAERPATTGTGPGGGSCQR